jgi:uncharacterized membrane protein
MRAPLQRRARREDAGRRDWDAVAQTLADSMMDGSAGGRVRARKAGPERLGAFSDGVIAIIITIMVLDLKAPHDASLTALFALWPTFAAYALSYLFVAVVWVNHHHLLRYAEHASVTVIWTNMAFLFLVSLIPFCTSYLAENRMHAFTTALYAGNFLLITVAFMFFQWAITRQIDMTEGESAAVRMATKRNWVALLVYALAIPAAYLHPAVSLALILGVAVLYFVPEAVKRVVR